MAENAEPSLALGLYIVATPIGHLEDITLRALRVLRDVSLIAAEDTRTAQKLLRAYELQQPLLSLHRDNEAQRCAQIVDQLQQGRAVALISEAGTPCISDPGYLLVRACVEAGFAVIPIPGASALTTAVSAAGLPSHHVAFLGFLPARSTRRKRALQPYLALPATLVLYEAPHRVVELLDDLLTVLGDRPAVIARELTKLYEEFLRGTLSSLRDTLRSRDAMRGEFVVMVQGLLRKDGPSGEDGDETDEEDGDGDASAFSVSDGVEPSPELPGSSEEDAKREMLAFAKQLLQDGGRPARLARQLTSRFPSMSRNQAYQLLESLKDESP